MINGFTRRLRQRPELLGEVCGANLSQWLLGNSGRHSAVANQQNALPETVDAAVRLLQSLVPEDEQARIAQMAETELVMLDFGLGSWIRNNLGLWHGNQALLDATGEEHPDDASTVIIRAFWTKLCDQCPKVH